MNITEQLILQAAPNASAVSNGRKISQSGKFFDLCQDEQQTLIWGSCAGSGKNPYYTSVDFIDPASPVYRCSCPSRQFPCKHALGLMFDYLAGKSFQTAPVPEDIQSKRNKITAREEKKKSEEGKPKKVNKAARTKKLKKQLEGLDMAEKMVRDLLAGGLTSLSGTSVHSYVSLSKELGNYYLPGPQILVSRIIQSMQALQDKNIGNDTFHYQNAMRTLIQLSSTIKKARQHLNEKLEKDDADSQEDTVLYEALGGIWKLEELHQLGLMKEKARLVQLSFDVQYDGARKEFIDRGYWMDVESGEISQALNYRPEKALKYVKAEDSCFDALEIPALYYYPGDLNRRIRWERSELSPVTKQDLEKMIQQAQPDFASALKAFKNQIKNTLSAKYAAMLISYDMIGFVDETMVVQDHAGKRICIKDRWGMDSTSIRLTQIPNDLLSVGKALFGHFFYEEETGTICFQPLSLITDQQIVRLCY